MLALPHLATILHWPPVVFDRVVVVVVLLLLLGTDPYLSCSNGLFSSIGATHYTHCFQPLTGSIAEKHDAWIKVNSDGELSRGFKGKTLLVRRSVLISCAQSSLLGF
jgi:hypothetical protein